MIHLSEIEQQVAKEGQALFYSCKLKECIIKVDEIDINRSFECHQLLQMYKGLSLFESQQTKMAFECFEKIIEESKIQKNGKVDEIDVIIRILYQLECQYFHSCQAEENNVKLLQVTEEYKSQNEKSEKYEEGIYLFGLGMYQFIESVREKVNSLTFKYLHKAYNLIDRYRHEISIILGWSYFNSRKTNEAKEWFEKLYNEIPTYPSAANNYAILLNSLKEQRTLNLQKAEKVYMEEEELRGYNQVILSNIAMFFKKQNPEKEKLYMEKLYALNPKTSYIYCQYGQYLIRLGKEEEGFKLLYKAIELDPHYYLTYDFLYQAEMDKENYEKALEYCLKYLEIFPNDGYFQFNLAQIYEMINQVDLGTLMVCYQKAAQLKNYLSYKIASHSRLSDLYYAQQKYKESLEEQFIACNYQNTSQYNLDQDLLILGQIMDSNLIPLKIITELINNQYGNIVTRYSQISQNVTNNLLKGLLECKLETLRGILFYQAYNRLIEKELSFRSGIQFWDLYID